MTSTLRARGPEDLLAAVPVVLGFRPTDSLVMLTFDGRHRFHARLDLPGPEEDTDLDDLAETLLAPCRTHAVGRVVFAFFTADAGLAARVALPLTRSFAAAGVGVHAVLRAHDGCWARVPLEASGSEDEPVPYDEACHPFAVQAIFAGRVTRGSRDELRASLDPVPEQQRRVEARQRTLRPPTAAERSWVLDLLNRCMVRRAEPDEGERARLLRAIGDVDVRDAALFAVTRDTAPEHVRLWAAVLRSAPERDVAEAAAVTAFCAWQAGDGALAWCALDRCLAAEPGHRLGTCIAECLARAVPPSTWEEAGRRPDVESGSA